jgi:lysophospholipase L1-like esterase
MTERRRQWLLRGFSVAVGCLVGFGLLEGVGSALLHVTREPKPELPADLVGRILERGRFPETIPDPYLSFRPKPGSESESAHVNRWGLRGQDTSERPEPGVYRVLLLGGSVAWGYSAMRDEETVAAALEAYLDRQKERSPVLRDREIEVLNGGVPAYVSWQAALAYTLHHRRLKPHLIVTLDGANDYAAAVNSGVAGAPLRFDPDRASHSPRPTLLRGIGAWARYRLGRLQLAKYVEHARRPSLAEKAPPSGKTVADSYGQAIEHLAEIAALEDALVVPVLQPLALLPGSKPLQDFEQRLVARHDDKVPGVNAGFIENYAAMHETLARLSGLEGVFPLDATGVFRDETRITYVDHCHLTPLGRELLAAEIGDWILDVL